MTVKIGEVIGRIDGDGLVYDGVGISAKCIGRVDSDGYVYDGVSFLSKCIGRFGKVKKSEHDLAENAV
jgi:hypothetical protein